MIVVPVAVSSDECRLVGAVHCIVDSLTDIGTGQDRRHVLSRCFDGSVIHGAIRQAVVLTCYTLEQHDSLEEGSEEDR
jgi:hypothetical protein